jgi:hypothetical protein
MNNKTIKKKKTSIPGERHTSRTWRNLDVGLRFSLGSHFFPHNTCEVFLPRKANLQPRLGFLMETGHTLYLHNQSQLLISSFPEGKLRLIINHTICTNNPDRQV